MFHIMSERKTVLSLMTWNWQSGIGLIGGRIGPPTGGDRQARFREQAHQTRIHARSEAALGEQNAPRLRYLERIREGPMNASWKPNDYEVGPNFRRANIRAHR